MFEFEQLDPIRLIEEVKERPALYKSDQVADRDEKLALWKQIGAALFPDWSSYSKATAYDRVLHLQKKWRSLRDGYNRELRARKTGMRINARVYMHYKRMRFLGGHDGELSDANDAEEEEIPGKPKKPRPKRRKAKSSSSEDEAPTEEFEMPVYPSTLEMPGSEDSDRLFLLSFLPEMRQMPPNIKMWARAQIARVMQEAVASQYSEAGASTESDLGPAQTDAKIMHIERDDINHL